MSRQSEIDACAAAAHGARVCAISLIRISRGRKCVFSMSGDALTLRSDMSKNAGMNVRVSSD